MTKQKNVGVKFGKRSYDVKVGIDLIDSAGEQIAPYLKQPRVVVITDSNVAVKYLSKIKNSLLNYDIDCDDVILPPGEETKNIEHFERLINQLLDLRIERETTLIALGGGVVGDLVGFAAAVILRGINFIQIPTTLLAQVDSSIGGKTGINTPHGKNLLGVFYQPKLVLADISTLDTLPRREILAGYAEVIKYGLVNNIGFFEWLESNGQTICNGNKEIRMQAVLDSCRIKAAIVSEDEREYGGRALLNLGHTFGHALEVETGFSNTLIHGEAIAIGTGLAFNLSSSLGFCKPPELKRVQEHYRSVGLPTKLHDLPGIKWEADKLINHMMNDKKLKQGQIRFILPRGIGQTFIADDIPIEEVRTILDNSINRHDIE